MSKSPSSILKQIVKFLKEEHHWLLPTTCPPSKLKPRTVCCQEGEDDEDTTPIDTPMKVKDKMSSFTHLLSDFWYNSLGSTCTCPYLFVGTNVFQSASSSKSNIRFVGSPIVLQWEGRNTSIRCVIEVNEHFMESLFDRISNGSCLNSISCRQDFQFIKTFCRCFYRDLHHRLGLVIHTWDPGPSWSTPQTYEEELKDDQGRPPPWPPP